MNTVELITPLRVSRPPEPSSTAHHARSVASTHPKSGETPEAHLLDELEETASLVGAVAVAGPPAILVAGPWMLLALALAGPFTFVLTLVAMLVAAVAALGLIGAIVAAPFLLVRHRRAAPTRYAPPAHGSSGTRGGTQHDLRG